ncbi:transposase [Streptomyces pseudogriseolus]|uniref:transposase n=1 Tax=Streptomyces pseudogriseolus TaxID=36817 RepID=UPI003FA305C1
MRRHELTDQEWELLAPLIPRAATGQQMRGGPAGHQRHGLQDPHTGISWRDLPEHHGPWKTVCTRFRRDALDGCSPNPCSSSRSMPTQPATSTGWSRSTPPSSVPTSTPPPPAEKKGGRHRPDEPDDPALGRSRGGLTTKIHLACDGKGRPLAGTDPRPLHRHGPTSVQARPGHRRQGLQLPRLPRLPAKTRHCPHHPRRPTSGGTA